MTTLKPKKILLSVVCIILAISFCGCTENFNIIQETTNIVNFVTEATELTTLISDPNLTEEEKLALVNETLFHEDSGLTVESILEDIQSSDKFPEITENFSFDIVSMPDPTEIVSSLKYDEAIGGNTYTTTLEMLINGVTVSVEVVLLSDESGLGIYEYEIK